MIRIVVLYEQEPDAEEYAGHAEVCRRVPGGTFRHGRVFGTPPPMGEPPHRYMAEWEFPDRDAFDAAVRSGEFTATAKDLQDRGLPMPAAIEFVELG